MKRSTKIHRYYDSLSPYEYQLSKFDTIFAGLLLNAGYLTTEQLLKDAERAAESIR